MTEERLSGLTMLHVHRDRTVDADVIIQTSAGQTDRRLALLFQN